MKVIAHTGLVPVRAKQRTQFKPGTIYGMNPKDVPKAIADGLVELVQVAEDVKSFDLPDPGGPKTDVTVPVAADAVEIPEDWQDLHWTKLVKLAEQILGDKIVVPDGGKPGEVAASTVSNELARRAAAKAPPEASGNSKPNTDPGPEGGALPPAGGVTLGAESPQT